MIMKKATDKQRLKPRGKDKNAIPRKDSGGFRPVRSEKLRKIESQVSCHELVPRRLQKKEPNDTTVSRHAEQESQSDDESIGYSPDPEDFEHILSDYEQPSKISTRLPSPPSLPKAFMLSKQRRSGRHRDELESPETIERNLVNLKASLGLPPSATREEVNIEMGYPAAGPLAPWEPPNDPDRPPDPYNALCADPKLCLEVLENHYNELLAHLESELKEKLIPSGYTKKAYRNEINEKIEAAHAAWSLLKNPKRKKAYDDRYLGPKDIYPIAFLEDYEENISRGRRSRLSLSGLYSIKHLENL